MSGGASEAPRRRRRPKRDFLDTPLGVCLFVVLMGGIVVRPGTHGLLRLVCVMLATGVLVEYVKERARTHRS
ncbi:hypothetical protein H4W23_16420 [Streptomyces gardneri]|uniref:hypothetical protein n=1 Tax=Streptomyces gardneri TaxID=66892 RepID=UPI0006BD4B5A|nr:hypothetical protein [Streptomyces gardneri]QPK46062.1 hypothetical protein H4W23_16420 [Streptomyces gardneri]WRK37422.1 hypothetical protein U0M97_16500 [Streptomyces venezuelae]CUM40718.1 hypothetical protein BN2537_10401 [Streptomyces venezuelae]